MKKKAIEGYNALPQRRSLLKQLWLSFLGLDKFTKMAIVTMLVIALVTPTIITTKMILAQHAQDSTSFISTEGAKPLFSLTNMTDNQLAINNATISWTTSSSAKGKLFFWEDSPLINILSFFSLGKYTFTESSYNIIHTFTIPQEALKANTNYNYQISAVDSNGQEYTTKQYKFTTVFTP